MKALCDARAEFGRIPRLFLHRISKDVPHLILHAPRVPFRPLLEFLRDVILEEPNDELRHLLPLQK